MRVRVCVFVKYEMWMCLDGWRWHIALRPLYDVRDVVRSTPLCHAVLHIKYSICIAICVYHIDAKYDHSLYCSAPSSVAEPQARSTEGK